MSSVTTDILNIYKQGWAPLVMAKTKNPWIDHLQKFKKDNPKVSYKDAMKEAKKTYKKVA